MTRLIMQQLPVQMVQAIQQPTLTLKVKFSFFYILLSLLEENN